jgi:DNA-binding beta-propeller fold protein YncE
MALTPDGSLWVSTYRTLTEINTSTDQLARSIVVGGQPQDMTVSADGSRLYVANEHGWVGGYDLATLALSDSIEVSGAFGLALNPGGSQMWVTRSSAGMVLVFNTADWTSVGIFSTGGFPRRIAFAPDGTALIANELGFVHIARPN